jgi:hypothetical protein
MKKIIALAVASAFVAPAFAADVTVSGDVEYVLADNNKTEGVAAGYGDSDIFVTATETMDSGMTITLKQGWEDIGAGSKASGAGDTELTIGGLGFGSISMGQIDTAAAMHDEAASVAEAGGGFSDYSARDGGDFNIRADLATGVDGLSVSVGVEIDNADDSLSHKTAATAGTAVATAALTDSTNNTDNVMHTSASLNYNFGAGNVFYGTTDLDEEAGETNEMKNPTIYGANITVGPFFVAYQAISDGYQSKSTGTGRTGYQDNKTMGVTYNYGPGKVFVESNSSKSNVSTDTDGTMKETIYGLSYQMGSLNTYIQQEEQNAARGDAGITYVGVEYAF